MSGPNAPLDYHSPQPPGERRTGRNFGVGLLVGVAVTAVPWAMGYAGVPGQAVFAVAAALVVGALGAAALTSTRKRYPGFAPGLLVALGVALLVNGGLCFLYVARTI